MRDAGTEALNSLCKVDVADGMLNVSGYISGPRDSFKVSYFLHLWAPKLFITLVCQIVNLEPHLSLLLWYIPCRLCSTYVSLYLHSFICDYTSTIFCGFG